MSVIRNELLLAGDDAYNIQRSLRFRSSASASLRKNYSTSRTSGQIMTYSTWVKRGSLASGTYSIFRGYDGSSAAGTSFCFGQDGNTDKITWQFGGSSGALLATTAVYRDPSAWYHIVLAIDTTQATDTNRIKIYVNGTQVTSFSSTYYPSQNATHQFLLTNNNNGIGARVAESDNYFDGYFAETYCIDGQALTPSSFGENNAQTGVWQPRRYTGTYGTNGFYLPFSDNSSLSNLTADKSGNGNNWTANNISLTSGATYDSMTDVPTLTSATQANFAVLNPIGNGTGAYISDGNLRMIPDANFRSGVSTIAVSSGKYYFEWTVGVLGAGHLVGIQNSANPVSATNYLGETATSYGYYSDGRKFNNGSGSSYGASYTTGDVIGCALDMDAGTLTFYKNNTSQGTAYSSLSGTFNIGASISGGTAIGYANFGQRPFAYTPPTGFVALNTFNLPTPTIGATASTQASKYMNIVTWSGDNTSPRSITGVGFQPDLVWIKGRNTAVGNTLWDSVRGSGKELSSNGNGSEITNSEFGYLSSFNSDGFSLTAGTYPGFESGNTNMTGRTYVGWNWDAGSSTVTNTSGSISSQVRANTSAGFSIVTYTGNGSAGATVGHGLGVAPRMVIVKERTNDAGEWFTYHASFSATQYLTLNSTNGLITETTVWNNTAPSSTVFTLGSSDDVNGSSDTYVAYCFSEVAGYSRFGSYTGNGSTDGTMIFTGFRPKFIMVKRTDSSSNWWMIDTSRSPINQMANVLLADSSGAEFSSGTGWPGIDFLSNGFKLRGTASGINASGGTWIYMAFAEVPQKFALGV